MGDGRKSETDSRGVSIAGAPPPPPRAASAAAEGFSPKSHKLLIEVLLVVAVVLGFGAFAVYGGGALSEALTPLVPLSVDQKLGALSSSQMQAGQKLCDDPATIAYVRNITDELLAAHGKTPFSFEIAVVEDDQVNAFALPGGYLTVNSGLLATAETGEEVAGVLGHEIYHALLRHGTKRILREVGGSIVLSLLLGGTGLEDVGGLAKSLTGLSYDRSQESEADLRGAELLQKAGLDPSGLARFFERLAKESPVEVPALLSTHPDPGDRAAIIAKLAGTPPTKKLASPRELKCRK